MNSALDTDRDVPPLAWAPLAAIVSALVAVLLATSGRYGYHRDELYFLACGRHPAWGYPDQPPLTPLIARAMDALGNGSLTVFRLPATVAAALITLLTALMARELGGNRAAQVLAALATSTGTFVLLLGHLLVTSTIDGLVWVALTWIVLRVLRTGDDRLWVPAGGIAAVGLLNKQLPTFLALGLAVGFMLTPAARFHLRSRWLWMGAALAIAAWVPVLWWQSAHGWPQLTLAGQIRDEYGTAGERVGFFALQLVMYSLGASFLWMTGVYHLCRDQAWRRYRVFAWAWLVILAALAITAGQGYYPAGIYPVLIAAGAVAIARRRRAVWIAGVAVVITGALTSPAALPILPPHTLDGSVWSGPGETQLETVGWQHLVEEVAAAYHSLPAAAQQHAGIFTSNYGEAGAVDRYGPARGLPQAWSGHNGFGLWGPPPSDIHPVIVIAEEHPLRDFRGCRLFTNVTGPVTNEETQFAAIYVCDHVKGSWQGEWPKLRHLSS